MIDAVTDATPVYLDSKMAAQYMAFKSVRHFRVWARRMRIKALRRAPGRVLLFRRADLDATLVEEPWGPAGEDAAVTPPDVPPRRRGRGRPRTRPQ